MSLRRVEAAARRVELDDDGRGTVAAAFAMPSSR